VGCTGETPNSGIGERKGARGRIQGFLIDAETGQPMSDVIIKTSEVGTEVSATSKDGFFVLDKLTAGGTYRMSATKEGFVPRIFNATIGQVPQDAYDALPVANMGTQFMSKPNGSVKGRVEFINAGQMPQMLKNATVVMDFAGSATFMLSLTATTNDQGEFTFTGLPSHPTGSLNQNLCVTNLKDGADDVIDFAPTCVNVAIYPNQTNYVVIRPSRIDLNNADVNVVQGVVRDNLTRLPMAGVEVFEVGKEAEKVVTDANGFYFIKTSSINRFAQFNYRKMSYAEGYSELNLGRGGTSTLPINMYPGGASIVGRLLYANLQPAKQAEVRIDLRQILGGSTGFNVFKVVKTNDTGDFTLDNLPGWYDGLGVNVSFTPWSADPDLFPETTSQSVNVALYPGSATPLLRQLTSNANLSLIAWNAYTGFINPTEAAQLQVSLPTLPAENRFTLIDSNSGQPMPFTVAYADNNRKITVTPSVGTGMTMWSENRPYQLQVILRANNGPQGFMNTSFNFQARSSLQTANIAGKITGISIDNPDIDATTRVITMRWAPLPDAFSYSLYLRTVNTPRLPGYVRFTTVGAAANPATSFNLGGLSVTSTLEPIAGQPFAFGQIISFMVVPVDSRGIETDASKGATIDLKDITAPNYDYGVAQMEGAAGAAHDIRMVIHANEALDRNNPPMTTLPAGLAFKSWTVEDRPTPPSSLGGIEGILTLTGTLAATANMTVQVRDTSGNLSRALTVPVFANPLVPAQGFEGSGACSAAGWTADPNTTCAACTSQALANTPMAMAGTPGYRPAYDGSCALAFGDPTVNGMCNMQQIWAPLDLSGASFTGRIMRVTYRYWPYFSAGYMQHRCDFFDTVSMGSTNFHFIANNNNRTWQPVSGDLTGNVGRVGRLRCTMDDANTCGSRGGVQMDDVRIYMK
jgi:hypothetical protein